MLKNYTPAHWEVHIDYHLAFDDGRNNGFGFPCDKSGKLLETPEENPAAYKNYLECLKHPERFARFNEVVEYSRSYMAPGTGVCSCGDRVYLKSQYCGGCQCSNCGQWYNLFGEELLPPEQWGDPASEFLDYGRIS